MLHNGYFITFKDILPPDDVIVHKCEQCGGEIYKGEEYYTTKEGALHEDCFQEFAEAVLDATLTVAEL